MEYDVMGPVFQQEVQVLQCVAEGANFNNLNINYVHEYSHVPTKSYSNF
ncbi:MAG: hypothetical protein KBD64_05630 [Gammaproteobacteria bacterium]|nr:hypothetical protein [Gammaproteobacteria bacterium]